MLKKDEIIENLKDKTINESMEDFLGELISLIESNVLTKEQINKIKYYISKEYTSETKQKLEQNKKMELRKKMSGSQLIKQILCSDDKHSKEELISRGINIDEQELIKALSNIELIDIYKQSNKRSVRDALIARGKAEFLD